MGEKNIMRESEILLLEKDVEVEKKLESASKKINLSSIKAQVETPKTENIVIETPNYDLLPEPTPEKKKRILKLEKTVEKKQTKTKKSVVKIVCAALLIGLVVGLAAFTGVELSNSINAYNAAESTYSINAAKLMQKIYSTDSGNKTAELIETFPTELMRPDGMKKESNWFDRFCKFLSGFFGG